MHRGRRLIHLLYPPACLLCRAALSPASSDDAVCPACRRAMPRCGGPLCQHCGVTLPGAFDAAAWCTACRRRPPAFDQARAPWQYAAAAQHAIQQFKYHRHWRIGRWLAHDMARTAQEAFPQEAIAAVIPMPLHWLKRRLRGFNPAEELAATVARLIGKPYLPHAIRRCRWTRTQTRLRWSARFQNVRNAFAARTPLVAGRGVLVVDDVLTSGATADACARTLRSSGANAVFILTAARTPLQPFLA